MYNSDYDVHNAVFVDHLNTSPNGSQSYTNWYNSKTGNSGIIKVTRPYTQGPLKCKDYDATVDITNNAVNVWYRRCEKGGCLWYCLSTTRWTMD